MRAEQGTRVLIVDDSKSALHALKNFLDMLQVEIVEAENAFEGWDRVQEQDFDLVITDVAMPGMDGFMFCEKIKNNEATKNIPVIILSIHDDDDSIEKGFRVGASAFVSKTDAAIELVPQVESVLASHRLLLDRTILIVEDSKSIRMMVADELEQAGFQVKIAGDGLEALRVLENLKPDLVLTDIEMPNLDGQELCRILQNNEEYKDIPIVIMSSISDRSKMRRLIRQGAATYITKPFNPLELVLTIEKILSDHFRLILEEKQHIQTEQRLTMGAISSLINALEARDKYTKGHSENVARVAVCIGIKLGLDEMELEELELIGKLHDLGKIGVRDDVLLKPGKLSDDEYEHIKTHTTVASTILEPMFTMSKIIQVASTHHERWDGNGYPQGLKGEDIPLYGRIIGVADVYDALTSDRPYRKAMSREKAVAKIIKMGGTQLCPTCIEAFKKCHEELGKLVRAESLKN